jgi:hypothetical protein
VALLLGAGLFGTGTLDAQRPLQAVRDLTIDANTNNLSAVTEVVVSRTGVIAVLQHQDMLIRFFSPSGALLGTFGRDGGGPGEFRSMGWIGWIGDTLHVEDSGLKRTTFVGPNLKLVRTVPDPVRVLPPATEPHGEPLTGDAAIVGVADDGSYLLDFFPAGATPSWLGHPAAGLGLSILRVTPSGRFAGIAASLESRDPHCSWGSQPISIPFCSHVVDPEHFDHAIAIVSAGEPRDSRFHLQLVATQRNDTLINREIGYTPVPIPRHVVDSVRADRLANKHLSPQERSTIESIPSAPNYPPVRRSIVGSDRSVWLEENTGRSDLHRWLVVDSHGNTLGIVTLPASVTVKDVRSDAAWGADVDADGLQDIVRFRITVGH